jgi:hypothetical protein
MRAICVECWNPDALVRMSLDGDSVFRCDECEAEFGCDDVRAKLEAMQAGWAKLLTWAESYPAEEAEAAAN